jgi:Mg2+ and Co2+ transporter CorA
MSYFIKISDLQDFLQGIVERSQLKDMAGIAKAEEPRLTFTEIVDNGKQMIIEAVECVITKHEKELKIINNKIKLESKSALASIARTGTCRDQMHSLRMAAIRNDAMLYNNHQRYVDSLSKGGQQYTDLLAPKMLGLQTLNAGLC